MKKVALRYGVMFGKWDASDWIDYEIELTDEEEAIYDNAIANEIPLEDVAELQDALDRAYEEIEDMEISDDSSCSPRGGWFPDIVKGPSAEEAECLSAMMEAMEFDEDFFIELIDDCGEFDEEYVEAYFEENDDEDSLKIYRKIKKKIDGGKTPFASVNDFASALGRYGLDNDYLYYEWEGEYIDFHDNICETGKPRGYYESIDAADWIEILENIDDHIVGA